MMQTYERRNCVDENGNPSGGSVNAVGVQITWQNGPLGRGDERKNPNGAFVETVIAAALQRIQWYQTVSGGKFACRENAIAITKLEEALMWLDSRTRRREMQGVEGTHRYEEATRTEDTVAALINRVLSLESRVSNIGAHLPAACSQPGIEGIALHDPEGTTGTCEGK